MAETTILVNHESGLHARPLAQFVKTAKQFEADIQVWNLTKEKGPSPGNSPLKLMLLAIAMGDEMKIATTGAQADEALAALETLVKSNFGEGGSAE